jgi:hypothetical protein
MNASSGNFDSPNTKSNFKISMFLIACISKEEYNGLQICDGVEIEAQLFSFAQKVQSNNSR